MKDTQKQHRKTLLSFLVVAGGFLITALVAWFFLGVFEIPERIAPVVPYEGYDRSAMQRAVAPDSVGAFQAAITDRGSRFMGQPGFYAVEDHIRKIYKEAGLEIYEQENWSVAPKTLLREITLADGSPMRGVEIFPLMPNHTQPMVTLGDGIEGTLVLLTPETIRNAPSLKGRIGLVDSRASEVSKLYGHSWLAYARLGLAAVIVSHPEALTKIQWNNVASRAAGMTSSVPVNYLRLIATPEIFNYLGQRIRLKVKTKFENTRNTTIMAVLRAPGGASKALLITGHYDACSLLPDMAPGTMQALTPATQLALLKGLLPYRDTLRRDVIFVSTGAQMMANDGINQIISILGPNAAKAKDNPLLKALGISASDNATVKIAARLAPILEREEENDIVLGQIDPILTSFKEARFMIDRNLTAAVMDRWDRATRNFFEEQFTYVLNTLVFETSEEKLQADILMAREDMESGGRDPLAYKHSPSFNTYKKAAKRYNQTKDVAGFSVNNLLKRKQAFIAQYAVRNRLVQRFEELLAHHERVRRRVTQDKAIVDLFSPYAEIVIVDPTLAPAYDDTSAKEILSFTPGQEIWESPSAIFQSLLSSTRGRLGLGGRIETPALVRLQKIAVESTEAASVPQEAPRMWTDFGYPAFILLNFGRSESYNRYALPVELPYMRDVRSIRNSLSVVGEAVLSMAHGIGRFPSTTKHSWWPQHIGGEVRVSNVGNSIVPNYPLKNALITTRSLRAVNAFGRPGFYDHLLKFADVYGKFSLPNQASDFAGFDLYWAMGGYSPFAVGYGADGLISHVKDEGEEGQRLYKSINLSYIDFAKWRNITIVTFRATGVTILDMTNPQTMNQYTGVELLSQKGAMTFRKKCVVPGVSVNTVFVDPAERFFVTLKAGAADNEFAQVTRAFMLGNNENYRLDPEKVIDGPGYLAAENPIIPSVPFEVAASMIQVNDRRLNLQDEFGMVDAQTREYHDISLQRQAEGRKDGLKQHDATLIAGEAVTYATLNHPVIRESVNEAVFGILWYLALLAPFAFFFEKLVFGFTDVRKQVTAQAVVFITVFGLLRVLHPAFEMVRSSAMILLGFIIILISGGITTLFAGKFKENLDEIKKKRGRVTSAEVNKLGVLGTAFMLGLTNMRRRKVRTGLTCATLVLMTFVMICFTSVHNEVVDESIALGKAAYQGLLIKRERLGPIYTLAALENRYGDRYQVCARRMAVGSQNWVERRAFNPQLEISHRVRGNVRKVEFDSIIQLDADEPLRDQITFVSKYRWFTEAQELDIDALPVFLSERMANELGVHVSDVNASFDSGESVEVFINGRRCQIQGVFDTQSYEDLRDIDGKNLLPFDVEAMKNIVTDYGFYGNVLAYDDDPRIPAHRIVIAPFRSNLRITAEYTDLNRIASVAITMGGETYKNAKGVIDTYLEGTAEPAVYGLAGLAYRGKRLREVTMAGLMQMIIPLIIAALTVLNTMKGSVYERRDEIFVYNAVGIAPRYVFFMFFAEALVYVVVGAILGYILSQGTGRILIELSQSSIGAGADLTGGLKMAFTSRLTVYASLAIGASVFISTYFPARSAMEIAAPAEDSGWELPEPAGDVLSFSLPFTFSPRDRIAVLSFFRRYLQDHGEGGSGRFFSGPSDLGVCDKPDPLAEAGPVPCISSTIWLKPFDHAVSQRMEISLPTDSETGEFIARVTLHRLSGTREAWVHLNKGFVHFIRRQFLHWRAVSDDQRAEMFREAKELFVMQTPTEAAAGG